MPFPTSSIGRETDGEGLNVGLQSLLRVVKRSTTLVPDSLGLLEVTPRMIEVQSLVTERDEQNLVSGVLRSWTSYMATDMSPDSNSRSLSFVRILSSSSKILHHFTLSLYPILH